MKQVWWYIKYTFCYQLSKVYFWQILSEFVQGSMGLLLK